MGTQYQYPDPNKPPPPPPIPSSQSKEPLKVTIIGSVILIAMAINFAVEGHSARMREQAKEAEAREQAEINRRAEEELAKRPKPKPPIKDYISPPEPPLTRDGVAIPVLAWIVINSKDPKSVELIGWTTPRRNDRNSWSQVVRFRGKNSFNAYTVDTYRFVFTKDEVWGDPTKVD